MTGCGKSACGAIMRARFLNISARRKWKTMKKQKGLVQQLKDENRKLKEDLRYERHRRELALKKCAFHEEGEKLAAEKLKNEMAMHWLTLKEAGGAAELPVRELKAAMDEERMILVRRSEKPGFLRFTTDLSEVLEAARTIQGADGPETD